MSDYFVMRRANGDLFTEEVNGKLVVPVWRSTDGVARHQARNPELITFLPARLDRKAISKASRDGLDMSFFLVSEDDPEADLDEGRPLSAQEVLSLNDQPGKLAGAGA
jgi:hypothetical protein